MNRTVGAHREAGAQRLLDAIGTERDRDHLALAAFLLDPQSLLQGELVVGRDDPRDTGGIDGPRIAPHLHLGRGVRDLLHHHEDLHALGSLVCDPL